MWVAGEEHEAAVHAVLDGSVGEAEAGDQHIAVLASMSTHLNPAAVLAVYFPISRPPDDSEMDLLAEFAEQAGWRWTGRRPSRTGRGWPSSPTATGSRASCTTW